MPPMPVSATEIRQRVASAAEKPPEITDMIIDMVSEPVARYISMNRLYTTC